MKFEHKKFFGQNFLSNKNILNSLVGAGNISKKDIVLEVGPGMGTLTELLATCAKKVIAIEKDRDLILFLREKFAKTPNVEIIEGDVLKIFNSQFSSATSLKHLLKIGNCKLKIVANIPYYITGKFLRLFLENTHLSIRLLSPSLMVLMVQKEVADRIVAKDGKESLLSLSVKAYGIPKIIRKVPRGAFVPPPNVDSAIIQISEISDAWFRKNKINPDEFFTILRSAFQQKRKTLKKSLSCPQKPNTRCLVFGGENMEKFGKKRPEELSLDDWALICPR